jgi:hypothetical protein
MSTTTPAAGERILWSGSLSHWHFAGRWLCLLLALAALAASFFIPLQGDWIRENFGGHGAAAERGAWIIRGLLLVAAVVLFAWIAISRARRKYVVSSRRVGVEFGLISKTSNEIQIEHIRSINLTTSGLLGVLGVGRLEFSSAATDDAEVVFWQAPRAQKLRDMVRQLQVTT